MNNGKEEIRKWWSDNPMTYGLEHGATLYRQGSGLVTEDLGTKEFFKKADTQLFGWNIPLHDESGMFGKIFPYNRYKNRKVLEIGCGMGGMSMLWAGKGAKVTAVDLSSTAVEQTRKRFTIFNLDAEIRQEDAHNLSFKDESFDYVYSWGVLHHSPNLEKSIAEMMRVLKTGGGYGVMLYNRHSIYYNYMIKYIEGFLHYENNFLDPLKLSSRYGDGYQQEGNPYTWPVTSDEVKKIFSAYSKDVRIKILGTDLDWVFKLLLPGLGLFVPRWAKKVWARRYGWSLWIYGHKG